MGRIRRFEFGVLFLPVALILGNVLNAQDNSVTQPAGGILIQSPDGQENSGSQTGTSPNNSKMSAAESSAKSSNVNLSDHKTHVRLGTVSVGAGYSRFSIPPFYSYGPYGFYRYDAMYPGLLWSPVWGPYYGPEYLSYGNGKGEVRLAADPKDAAVYLDGAYAGTANRLKNIWLDPGAYDLSVSAKGRESFQQRIYVLSGKTLKLTAKLEPQATP